MAGLPAVPAGPVRWTAADAVTVVLGTQLLSLLWAGGGVALAYGSGGGPDPLPVEALFLLNIGLWVGYGLGPVLVVSRKGTSLRSDLGARLARFDVPAGLMAGVAAQAALMPALYWPIRRLIDGDPSASARDLVGSAQGPFQVLVLVVATAVLAPLTEELFYRGLFLRVSSAVSARWRRLWCRPPCSLPSTSMPWRHRACSCSACCRPPWPWPPAGSGPAGPSTSGST